MRRLTPRSHFTWNGESYLKKPPLLFWTLAGSFKAFGENEFAARLPSVAMGLGTLLLTYAMAAEVFGRLTGLFAAMVPLGFYFFVARGGRECATDAPLIFFSTLAIFALARARIHRRWTPLVGAACGLAMLSKGAAGLIPLTVGAISIVALPAFSESGLIGLAYAVTAAACVAAPWFLYQAIHNGSLFWSTYVKQETLMRIASHLEGKPAAAGFTWHTLINEVRYLRPLLLPLAGLGIAALHQGLLSALRRIPAPVVLWLLWFAVAFIAACAVQTKLGWYLLPALIPAALLAAAILAGAFIQGGSARNYCRPLAATALVLLTLSTPRRWARIDSGFALQRARSRPSYEMAMRSKALAAIHGGGELYFAGVPLPTMVYYSGMRCHFVSPSEPDFELADLGGNPISVSYHELVLRDPNGVVTAVDNFGEEWNQSGPELERGHHPIEDTAGPPLDVRALPE